MTFDNDGEISVFHMSHLLETLTHRSKLFFFGVSTLNRSQCYTVTLADFCTQRETLPT